MDPEQLAQLRSALTRQRATLSRQGEGISRRLEGEVTQVDIDARGYAAVVCYIQRGLEDARATVREVLSSVLMVRGAGRHKYPVYHFSFGWPDGDLPHDRPTRHTAQASFEADLLLALAGPGPAESAPLIEALWSKGEPPLPKPGVAREDLLVFFCRDRGVRLSADAQQEYARFKRRALWIFVDAGQVEWAMSTFDPAVAPAVAAPPAAIVVPPAAPVVPAAAPAAPASPALDEHVGKRWQTRPLAQAPPSVLARLKRLAAIIATHYAGPGWEVRLNRGSLTFQHPTEKHRTICLFVDIDNKLLEASGIGDGLSILERVVSADAPRVVLAAELTELPPDERQHWREELRRRFGKLYCDPEAGFDKYWLAPNKGHLFDVAFFGVGECELEASDEAGAVIAELFGDAEDAPPAPAEREPSEVDPWQSIEAIGACDRDLNPPPGQLCQACGERPATRYQLDTWLLPHEQHPIWLCGECRLLT